MTMSILFKLKTTFKTQSPLLCISWTAIFPCPQQQTESTIKHTLKPSKSSRRQTQPQNLRTHLSETKQLLLQTEIVISPTMVNVCNILPSNLNYILGENQSIMINRVRQKCVSTFISFNHSVQETQSISTFYQIKNPLFGVFQTYIQSLKIGDWELGGCFEIS